MRAPQVTGVSPDHGPDTGGNNVTVTGSGFAYVTRFKFSNSLGVGTNPHTILDDRTATVQPGADPLDELVHVWAAGPYGVAKKNGAYQYDPTSSYDPAVLSLTGWWRADYSGAPWVGTPSAGTSGSHNLTTLAADPTAGTAVNTHPPAHYASSQLAGPTALTTIWTAGAGTILALVKASSLATETGNVYDDPTVLRDTNADTGLSLTKSGARGFIYDGAYKSATAPFFPGAYHLIRVRWDSSNIGITIDNGTEIQTPAGAAAVMSGVLNSGAGYGGGFIDGDVLELVTLDSSLADIDYGHFLDYCRARYAFAATPISVSSISPSNGDVAGGTSVTITGSGFTNAVGAFVGGVPLTSFVVVNDTTITGVTGAHAAGSPVDVVVHGDTLIGTLASAYTYQFNLASLPWSAYWVDHTSAPWVGTPSTGTSGSHNVSTVNSTNGVALNGHTTADYASQVDTTAATADAFYTNSAYSGAMVFYADTATADAGSSSAYLNAQMLGYETTALFGVAFSTAGVDVWQYDGAWKTVRIACATGGWHLIEWKYDGVNLHARLDGGAWATPVAVTSGWGGFSLTTHHINLGSTSYATNFDGRLAIVLLADSVISDSDFDNTKAAINTLFGTSF